MPKELLNATFRAYAANPGDPQQRGTTQHDHLRLQGVQLVHIIVSRRPEWLRNNQEVFAAVMDVWTSSERWDSRKKYEEKLPLTQVVEPKQVLEIILAAVRLAPDQVDRLWTMLRVFESRSLVDYTFLVEFYKNEVAKQYTAAQRRAVVVSFLNMFRSNVPVSIKIHAISKVIVPILEAMPRIEYVKTDDESSSSSSSSSKKSSQASAPADSANPVFDKEIVKVLVAEILHQEKVNTYPEVGGAEVSQRFRSCTHTFVGALLCRPAGVESGVARDGTPHDRAMSVRIDSCQCARRQA